MRKQYHYWLGDAWDVSTLIELSTALPVRQTQLSEIADIDREYWYDGSDETPTVRNLVEHMRLVNEADLSYPIICGADGRVMDGMHRVARALLEDRQTIAAVRFESDPAPDYRDCRLTDLPYD